MGKILCFGMLDFVEVFYTRYSCVSGAKYLVGKNSHHLMKKKLDV